MSGGALRRASSLVLGRLSGSARQSGSSLQQQRGTHDLSVHPNKHIEKWLSKREDIDAEFVWNRQTITHVIIGVLVIPTAIYNGLVYYAHKDDEYAERPKRWVGWWWWQSVVMFWGLPSLQSRQPCAPLVDSTTTAAHQQQQQRKCSGPAPLVSASATAAEADVSPAHWIVGAVAAPAAGTSFGATQKQATPRHSDAARVSSCGACSRGSSSIYARSSAHSLTYSSSRQCYAARDWLLYVDWKVLGEGLRG